MQKKLMIFSLILILLVSLNLVAAQNCDKIISSSDFNGLIGEINSINSKLISCNVVLPGTISGFIGDGTSRIDITTNSASQNVVNLYLTISGGKFYSISLNNSAQNSIKYVISTDEDSINQILKSSDRPQEIALLYSQGKIKIQGNTLWNKLKLFFAKPFINKFLSSNTNSSQNTQANKPENCDETYLPGHKEYSQNKELWDSYSSNADGVCQSQYGKGIPSPCIHSVQLSVEGNPYYLCWYNN